MIHADKISETEGKFTEPFRACTVDTESRADALTYLFKGLTLLINALK